jgi:alkylhydroperoxidase family enzyme
MPRIPYADPATLPPEARAIFDGARAGVVRVLANAADSVAPWVAVVGGIRNSPELEPLHRELVILRILTTVDAPHEWDSHEAAARAAEATDAQIEAIRSGRPVEGPAGELVSLVGDLFSGDTPDDARFARVLEIVSPRALVEAILIAGVYGTIGRLFEAIGPGAGPIPDDAAGTAAR